MKSFSISHDVLVLKLIIISFKTVYSCYLPCNPTNTFHNLLDFPRVRKFLVCFEKAHLLFIIFLAQPVWPHSFYLKLNQPCGVSSFFYSKHTLLWTPPPKNQKLYTMESVSFSTVLHCLHSSGSLWYECDFDKGNFYFHWALRRLFKSWGDLFNIAVSGLF